MKKAIAFLLLLSLVLLSGCAGSVERALKAGQKALAAEKYAEAAAAFQKAGSLEDAEQLLEYANAWLELENGSAESARAGFEALGDFKDSALMLTYCEARAQEAAAEAAFAASDAELAVSASREAFTRYSELSFFRDSDQRTADCRNRLYAQSSEWMNLSRYDAAASGFAALGTFEDSAVLQKYCKAAALEDQGSYIEAANLYSEIPDVMDASARAESAQNRAYQLAVSLTEAGDYEKAIIAFAALGSYRDAAEQRDRATMLLVQTLLQSGAYHEALVKFSQLEDRSVFSAADAASGNYEAFLIGFLNAWLSSHAKVMNAFFSCNLVQPYLEPGGELDMLLRAEITDDIAPVNYGFLFNGVEVKELLTLDDGFVVVLTQASASCTGPEGPVNMDQAMWVLMDTGMGNPLAAAVLAA
ncbi:MAG: hypothetical protein IJV40_08965 [Oscillospiraceae bacterium]|nr:hypothetical protein [Oscillospiraceae bacterium]